MQKSVKIYTLSTCSHCKATKKLLNDLNVSYDCTDVDLLDTMNRASVLEEIKKINPRCTFPTIIIGEGIIIIGYRENEIKEALDL
jgi:glutaredoxin-like protein NrdH